MTDSGSNAPDINNIRAALNWAFAPEGDAWIGVALAAASAPIWLEMSLLTECVGWMEKALDHLDAADRGTRREMALQCTLGLSLMFTQDGTGRPEAALTRANQLAESVQDFDYQLQALYGRVTISLRLEDFRGALALARRSEAIAKRIADRNARSTADRILSAPLFFLAEFAEALTCARRTYRRDKRPSYMVRSGYDLAIWARCVVAQILWHQGLLDQAVQAGRGVLADAEASGNPVALCVALIWAGCPISLRLGDLETAERSIARLKDDAEKHAFSGYHASGLGFEGQLSATRGDVAAAERLLRAAVAGLREAQHEILYTPFLSSHAEVLATAGRLDESLALADEALQRTERNNAFWWMPEALRIKGKVLLLSDNADTTAAEDHFRRSLDLARRQGALSWELRTAMSLARLRRDQNRIGEARDLLAAVYGRFTEGLGTADLQSAKRLLDELTEDTGS